MEGRREVRTMATALAEFEAPVPPFVASGPVSLPDDASEQGSEPGSVERRLADWIAKVDR